MNKKTILMGAAMAGMILTSCGHEAHAAKATDSEVIMCHGVNSCKGHGDCAGKINACSGKSGCEAKLTCAGHNSCKGKGLKKMTRKECQTKGGKVAS